MYTLTQIEQLMSAQNPILKRLEKEVATVKNEFHTALFSLATREDKQIFIQWHQRKLVELMNVATKRKRNATYTCLEQLLSFLQEYFRDYLDQECPVPMVCVHEIETSDKQLTRSMEASGFTALSLFRDSSGFVKRDGYHHHVQAVYVS